MPGPLQAPAPPGSAASPGHLPYILALPFYWHSFCSSELRYVPDSGPLDLLLPSALQTLFTSSESLLQCPLVREAIPKCSI